MFSKPAGFGDAVGRLRKNISHFGRNYLLVGLSVTALCVVFNPRSVVTLAFLGLMWLFVLLFNMPLRLGQREFSVREQVLGASGVTFLAVFVFSSVLSTFIYGMTLSAGIVGLHGSFREPEQPLFGDEPGAGGGAPVGVAAAGAGGLQAAAVMGVLQGAMGNLMNSITGSGGQQGQPQPATVGGPSNV